jgi:hypothetical protein
MTGRRRIYSLLTGVFAGVGIGALLTLIGLIASSHWFSHHQYHIASTSGSKMSLGSDLSTLRLYMEEASYFDECKFQHQPDAIEVQH